MQLALEGMDDAPQVQPRKHRLFFAIYPDDTARDGLLATARSIRESRGLHGQLIAPDRLHLTLQTFFEGKRIPPSMIELALRAGQAVAASPFIVSLDTALSFTSKPSDRPLVISGHAGTADLLAFRGGALADGMRRNAMGSLLQTEFVPHVTTLYDDAAVPPTAVAPISWMVREFVLIHSYVGLTIHRVLGRWRLDGR